MTNKQTNSKLRKWIETINDRKGRGIWGVTNSKLRQWAKTTKDRRGGIGTCEKQYAKRMERDLKR